MDKHPGGIGFYVLAQAGPQDGVHVDRALSGLTRFRLPVPGAAPQVEEGRPFGPEETASQTLPERKGFGPAPLPGENVGSSQEAGLPSGGTAASLDSAAAVPSQLSKSSLPAQTLRAPDRG